MISCNLRLLTYWQSNIFTSMVSTLNRNAPFPAK
jgi:hypothetical protein